MEETWKPTKRTNGLLEVSSLGRVRRVERALIYKDGRQGVLKAGLLKCAFNSDGYRVVGMGAKQFYVHRLVAEEFLPTPADQFAYQTINHKNGNKGDNSPENLEWATYASNNSHSRGSGLNKQHGENTNLSKYSDKFVSAIRNVHAKYSPSWKDLGVLFGISAVHARDIVLNLTRAKNSE